MKKIVVFLMMVGLVMTSRGVAAQDLFESQTLGEMPPQMMLPDPMETMSSGEDYTALPDKTVTSTPVQEPIALPITSADLNSGEMSSSVGQELQMFDCDPALLESTGTWLRRGFWFAEIDAVVANRSFDRDGFGLMQSQPENQQPSTFPRNHLAIDGSNPGAEGTPRLKVGRFLFRDETNRDHNLEFTIFGGSNFSQEGFLEGTSLVTPTRIAGPNLAFDGATTSQYRYDSFFNSFELNYHVRQRMLKDRMELEPTGQWVRRAQPSNSLSYLAGIRYFNFDEHLNWQAFGIPDADDDNLDETGQYDIQTGNHLIGPQFGLSSSYDTTRWSVGAQVKGGMYLNMMDLDSSFDVTGGVTSGRTDLQGDNTSWIGEAQLFGKYHILPNFSIRTAFEIMHVAGVALAPTQIDFVPSGSPYISKNNESVFLGGSVGFESYW